MNILVTGPESTGKSTICQWIAVNYQATLIPEYARNYLEELGPQYEEEDLYKIAQGHVQQFIAVKDEPFLVFDTFMVNIIIWSIYKYGNFDTRLVSYDSAVAFDLVFLATPAVPWKEDPLRENPGDREKLLTQFKYQLDKRGWEYIELKPGELERQIQVSSILKTHGYSLKTKSSI